MVSLLEKLPLANQKPIDPVLEPKLGPRWALNPVHVGSVLFWCGLFLVLNYIPLRGTDLWNHVLYGNWIIEHAELPTEDPVFGLAEGMPVVATAWLSQVIFSGLESWGGTEALSGVFALTTVLTFLVLARCFFLQSGQKTVCYAAVVCVIALSWSRIATIRPENFGALCFAGLLLMIASNGRRITMAAKTASDELNQPWSWKIWLGVPVIMAVWANLHGSFVCGLAMLACFFLGELIECAWRERNFNAVVADKSVRRWLYLCELALLATLLNPYGMDLLIYTLWFSGNENLKDILEWQPLVILGIGGREFALSWVLLLVVFRHSRCRVRAVHVLLLALFSFAVVCGNRMLAWYAMVFGFLITPHLSELWTRFAPAWATEVNEKLLSEELPENKWSLPLGRSWSYSLAGPLLAWIAFALAPVGRPVVGDDPRPPEIIHEAATPLGASNYLRENPVDGLIYCPQWWGDWIAWDAKPNVKPMMTSMIHLAPNQVWKDYQRISTADSNWQRILERYNITTLVADQKEQQRLIAQARRAGDWRKVYEDDQSVIYQKRPRTSDEEKSKDKATDSVEPNEAIDSACCDPSQLEDSEPATEANNSEPATPETDSKQNDEE